MPKNVFRDDIEYIIHSDSDGTIIGPISKVHAHLPWVRSILTHHSTWSMVYHPESGKYGIQRKNPKTYDQHGAGKWDMGVAGHNCYVQENGVFRPLDFEENLIKEAQEEIGIHVEMYHSKQDWIKSMHGTKRASGYIFDRFHYKTKTANEWVGLGFILVHDIDMRFVDGEVVDFQWLSPSELQVFIETNTGYCPPLALAFEKAEKFRKDISL